MSMNQFLNEIDYLFSGVHLILLVLLRCHRLVLLLLLLAQLLPGCAGCLQHAALLLDGLATLISLTELPHKHVVAGGGSLSLLEDWLTDWDLLALDGVSDTGLDLQSLLLLQEGSLCTALGNLDPALGVVILTWLLGGHQLPVDTWLVGEADHVIAVTQLLEVGRVAPVAWALATSDLVRGSPISSQITWLTVLHPLHWSCLCSWC